MKALGGNGGVIAIDPRGEIVLDFNSEGMFRGAAHIDGPERGRDLPVGRAATRRRTS